MALSAILACLIPVSELKAEHASDKRHPTVNTTKWTGVDLPFRPFQITAVKDAMWVCGTNEMIAVSTDGGATWHMQHQKRDGEILTKIAFVDTMIGHASGTNGLLLSTNDGGQTWSSQHTGASIRQFSFADSRNGIADLDGALKLTSDGGKQWRDIEAMRTDTQLRKFTDIMSLAALSPSHMIAAIRQPEIEERYLSTVDGGKTWTSTHLPNTIANSVLVHDGEYWAFGIEYLGRKHNAGSGYSVPVALHSTDGQTWQHGVRATWEFSSCTKQGCVLPYGVIEVLYGTQEMTWSLPQDLPTPSKWAMTGDQICVIDRGLRCGTAIASDVPQPAPEHAAPQMFQTAWNQPLVADCLDCDLPKVHFDASVLRGQAATAKTVVHFSVKRDGTIGSIEVQGAPSPSIAEDVRKEITGWLIAPAHDSTETIAQEKSLELRISCFAGFPGHPETAMCNTEPWNGRPAPPVVTVIGGPPD
jgi:hypothetical protein